MDEDAPTQKPATIAVKAGRPAPEPDAPLNEPITMASTYVAGADGEYGRYANPTWTAFEDALGALEGGRALSFASGMAAVGAVLDLVGQGAKVVAPRHAYHGCVMAMADFESRGRLRAELVDITDTDAVVKACDDAALVWLEKSPTNPALEIADIPTIAAAKQMPAIAGASDELAGAPRRVGARLVAPTRSGFVQVFDDAGRALYRIEGHKRGAAILTGDDLLLIALPDRRLQFFGALR